MPFSHILITRPRQEALELAELLASSEAEIIIMPAYEFHATALFADQISQIREAAAGPNQALLVFTSPRSVQYGLGQVPEDVLRSSKIAAIGPSTASMLETAGLTVTSRPGQGYSSEDLLAALAVQDRPRDDRARPVFIFTAPGGRTALLEGLQAQGYEPHMLMVYGRKSTELAPSDISAVTNADSLLAVWTSANTINSLSQRLPARCWSRLCRSQWLVISERLQRVARAFGPPQIHLSAGPTNSDIVTAIKAL